MNLTNLVKNIVNGKVLNSLGTKEDMRIYEEGMKEATRKNMERIRLARARMDRAAQDVLILQSF